MSEVTVGPHNYQIGRLDAFRQLHVSRRVLPVLIGAGVGVAELASLGRSLRGDDGALFEVVGKGMDILAKMSDEDVNYVVQACLSVVRRQQGERWAPMMNGKSLQFQDLEMPDMVRLCIETLRENMGNFFPAPVGGQSTETGS